jgi:hypothetical protein
VGSAARRRACRQHGPADVPKRQRLSARSAQDEQVTVCYKGREGFAYRVAAGWLAVSGEYGGFVDRIRDERLELVGQDVAGGRRVTRR